MQPPFTTQEGSTLRTQAKASAVEWEVIPKEAGQVPAQPPRRGGWNKEKASKGPSKKPSGKPSKDNATQR